MSYGKVVGSVLGRPNCPFKDRSFFFTVNEKAFMEINIRIYKVGNSAKLHQLGLSTMNLEIKDASQSVPKA